MNKFVFRSKVKKLMTNVKEILTRVKEHMTKVKEFIAKARDYVRVDGLLHIMASAIILLSLHTFMGYLWSLAITIVADITKELYDRFTDGAVEWHDLICDAIGIVYASMVILIGIL